MNELLRNKKLIIICILLIAIFYILSLNFNKEKEIEENDNKEYKYLDKYESNQFIPINITEEDVANIYLNDYKNILLTDSNNAYNLLNKDYRERKFIEIERFKEYISLKKSLEFYKLEVKEYTVLEKNNNKFYYIIASNDDTFIFKEKSIMNYEVFLDDYTVELK